MKGVLFREGGTKVKLHVQVFVAGLLYHDVKTVVFLPRHHRIKIFEEEHDDIVEYMERRSESFVPAS
ncbi:hypothetical protein D3C86_2112420 [compost metagenome]